MDENQGESLNWRFENLRRIAEGMTKLLGNNCEVVVHDFKDMKRSLVHISGAVTQRKIGAPVTDFVVKELKLNGDQARDFHNYKTRTASGRTLNSSTIFIRDNKGKVIGAMCINYDVTDISTAIKQLESIARPSSCKNSADSETFAGTFSETMDALFEKAQDEIGKHPSTMSRAEKIEFVRVLDREGAFLIKGAAVEVAHVLGVTRFTVYNYINEIRK